MKKIISTSLKILISVALFWFVFSKLNLTLVINTLKNINFFILLLALLFTLLSSFLLSTRWNIFLKKYKTIKNVELFKIYWASDFMNLFGLASVGGETYKTLIFEKDRKKVLFSSLLSRAYSFFGFILMGISAVVAYLTFNSFLTRIVFMLIIFSLLTGIAILLDSPIKQFIGRLIKSKRAKIIIEHSNLTKRQLLSSSLLNLLFVLNVCIVYSIVFYSIGLPLSFFELIVLVPIMSIAIALPISIQGIGIREFLFMKFAEITGLLTEKVIIVSVITYLISLIYGLLGSIFFVGLKKKN